MENMVFPSFAETQENMIFMLRVFTNVVFHEVLVLVGTGYSFC